MRHHVVSSSPRLAHPVPMVMAALLATITIGATACSGQTGAVVAPSVSATNLTASSSPQVPSSTLAPAGKTAELSRSTPVRLQIASIGVDSTLMTLGLRSDGSMQVPTGGFPAGWYSGGPTPGELGPAVIAGHVDMKGPGVFYNLHDVKVGDQVTITEADGSKPVFRVTQVAEYLKDQFPTKRVYGNIDHPGLRLITCGGTFDNQSGHYEDNLIVFADLVATTR